jgi:lysophospholipase L1-like esterase
MMSFDCDQAPSMSAVFEIDHVMTTWSRLERAGLWKGVHPNIKGNKIFAQAISQLINQWLGKTSKIV